MQFAKIVGTVVSTKKVEELNGFKLLICQVYNLEGKDLKPSNNFLVAADTVGAGANELVLLVSGSSARLTAQTKTKPLDLAVIGIIDGIDLLKGV